MLIGAFRFSGPFHEIFDLINSLLHTCFPPETPVKKSCLFTTILIRFVQFPWCLEFVSGYVIRSSNFDEPRNGDLELGAAADR